MRDCWWVPYVYCCIMLVLLHVLVGLYCYTRCNVWGGFWSDLFRLIYCCHQMVAGAKGYVNRTCYFGSWHWHLWLQVTATTMWKFMLNLHRNFAPVYMCIHISLSIHLYWLYRYCLLMIHVCGIQPMCSNYAVHFLNPDNISVIEASEHTTGEWPFPPSM